LATNGHDNYRFVVSRTDENGRPVTKTFGDDQRWYSVHRAHTMTEDGWELVRLEKYNSKTGLYEPDAGSSELWERHFGAKPLGEKVRIDYDTQETVRKAAMAFKEANAAANKGSIPLELTVRSANASIAALAAMGVTGETIVQALGEHYPALVKREAPKHEPAHKS